MDRREKKLLKYLRRDRYKKFRSYADKHGIILRDLRTENGENLLHEGCRVGKSYFLRYFLDKGVDPLFQNDRGEVPLHIACQRIVHGGIQGLNDLVKPLMRKCIAAAEIKDKNGRKPRDLLREFHEKVSMDEGENHSAEQMNGNDEEDERGEGESSERKEREEEEKWSRRLAEEMNDEYAEQWGNYEPDYAEPEGVPNTFDNWAEQIHQQRREKRQHTYMTFEEERERKRKKKEKEEEENRKRLEDLEREHQKYLERARDKDKQKLKKEKRRYSEKVKEFFAAKGTRDSIGYSDIPWPYSKSDKSFTKMKEFLLCDLDTKDVSRTKKYLKEQQIIWHPDRFSQKCGPHLVEEQREKIMSKVNAISQQLNAYLTEIS